jgi:hypothetical protein
MPPLGLHMTVARDLATELRSPVVDAQRGAYYLGSTTPDIRVLTRCDRADTHFFDLNDFGEQDGVHRLLDREPVLRDAAGLDPQTAAFVAGYISHLVLDEDYICQIYRPLFGERSPLKEEALADVMDKALQYDVDMAERNDAARVDEIRLALAEAAVEIDVGFIARDTLLQWRDISLDVFSHPPSVERFARFISRRVAHIQLGDEEGMARFVEQIPAILRRTWDHVGEERVREYLYETQCRALSAMKEYLS